MTGTKNIVVWGASGHAKVVADIIGLNGQYEIIGFLDDRDPQRKGENFCGRPILGGREQLDLLRERGVDNVILAFGNCEARLRLSIYAIQRGYQLVNAIHPRSTIASSVTIGKGVVIAAGAIVNPASVVGSNVIINTSASVDHDCVIEDGVHLSPGARLAGGVHIGRGTWVGLGSSIIDRVRVGEHSVIGAGAVVIRDVPDRVVVAGVPAKMIRSIPHGELNEGH